MKTLKFKTVRIETFAIKEGTVSTCHETNKGTNKFRTYNNSKTKNY